MQILILIRKYNKKVSVEVLNGSNISGLATKVAKQLEEKGFHVKILAI